ncbi:MAG: hypothetical protein KJ970_13300 [Candidatus Eisenbacteria bacterium]|uniref:Uncharacterized protein n=1 Tax=Eiseniibacteriota bacterium TaxID=2212470 RepID=A0A948RXQ4_UNCEI|nr:hypothetical protein [Candidatus Eisenbacteria bacterium]MBU1947893.1 hypothetical protein [Candidatus Eisenbacteria bacterium]MBU2691891.1 hypothetical protein [Candidatus Eisenbacteria bacterium]
MIVISRSSGFVLTFETLENLQVHVSNLKGFLENAESGQLGGQPFLYSVVQMSPVSWAEEESALDRLKQAMQTGSFERDLPTVAEDVCGAVLVDMDQSSTLIRCNRRKGHAGKHKAELPEGNGMTTWTNAGLVEDSED